MPQTDTQEQPPAKKKEQKPATYTDAEIAGIVIMVALAWATLGLSVGMEMGN
jgi:hypothetical protein